MQERSDQELLRAYATRRCEDSFAELARRHASLVYGAAFRKLGQAEAAEEVSQVVFAALARKAPLLCHHQNLSGWLHQTALLECRQWLRGELRRRRREEVAMSLHESPAGERSGLLEEIDEALMELPAKDRQPLLLRFFESRSLREVAGALGIKEDAAQKRVAKSLSLLERILRRRGRDVGGAALAAALSEAAVAAPAALAGVVTKGAMAGAVPLTGAAVVFAKFMALTKTQTAAVCVLLAAGPVLIESRGLRAAEGERARIGGAIAAARVSADEHEARARRLRVEVDELELGNRRATSALAELRAQATGPRASYAPEIYLWSDAADFVRLPKSILNEVTLTSFANSAPPTRGDGERDRAPVLDEDGRFSPVFLEALDITAMEQAQLEAGFRSFRQNFDAVVEGRSYVTNAMPRAIGFQHDPAKLRSYVTPAFPEEGEMMRAQLHAAFEEAIGRERAELLMRQASAEFDHAFLEFGKRSMWATAAPHEATGMFSYGESRVSAEGMSIGSFVTQKEFERLPEHIQALMAPFKEERKR